MSSEPEAKRPKVAAKANVLMVGTGEYTTGYVGGTAADSDKGAGVVALTMFDLRRRGKVERVGMCGVNVSLFILRYVYIMKLIIWSSSMLTASTSFAIHECCPYSYSIPK